MGTSSIWMRHWKGYSSMVWYLFNSTYAALCLFSGLYILHIKLIYLNKRKILKYKTFLFNDTRWLSSQLPGYCLFLCASSSIIQFILLIPIPERNKQNNHHTILCWILYLRGSSFNLNKIWNMERIELKLLKE